MYGMCIWIFRSALFSCIRSSLGCRVVYSRSFEFLLVSLNLGKVVLMQLRSTTYMWENIQICISWIYHLNLGDFWYVVTKFVLYNLRNRFSNKFLILQSERISKFWYCKFMPFNHGKKNVSQVYNFSIREHPSFSCKYVKLIFRF